MSDQLLFQPFEAIGTVRFGMNRSEVSHALSEQPKQFRKGPSTVVDSFRESTLHVYYDLSGCAEAVEVFAPLSVTIQDLVAPGASAGETVARLRALDPHVRIIEDVVVSLKFGVSVYVPGLADYPEEPVPSVMAFKRGYYAGIVD